MRARRPPQPWSLPKELTVNVVVDRRCGAGTEQPQVARPRHRVLRCLRRIIGVRQPLRAVRKQIAELKLAEPRQRQIEAAELKFAELEAEELAVPTCV
jgi:hypothetical protein